MRNNFYHTNIGSLEWSILVWELKIRKFKTVSHERVILMLFITMKEINWSSLCLIKMCRIIIRENYSIYFRLGHLILAEYCLRVLYNIYEGMFVCTDTVNNYLLSTTLRSTFLINLCGLNKYEFIHTYVCTYVYVYVCILTFIILINLIP